MKRYLLSIVFTLTAILSAHSMSYEQARDQALYLTDKMAYELNLTQEQWNEAYEINLDYLMGVTTADDVYGTYWTYRNDDLRTILLDWQWTAFAAVDYFYRPLVWATGGWYMPIYTHYDRGFFFYSCPNVYYSYCGGHGRGFYGGGFYVSHRTEVWCGGMRGSERCCAGGGVRNRAMNSRGGYSSRGSSYSGRGGNMGTASRSGSSSSYSGRGGNMGSTTGSGSGSSSSYSGRGGNMGSTTGSGSGSSYSGRGSSSGSGSSSSYSGRGSNMGSATGSGSGSSYSGRGSGSSMGSSRGSAASSRSGYTSGSRENSFQGSSSRVTARQGSASSYSGSRSSVGSSAGIVSRGSSMGSVSRGSSMGSVSRSSSMGSASRGSMGGSMGGGRSSMGGSMGGGRGSMGGGGHSGGRR